MKYIIYGTPNCTYCNMAKTLLEMQKQEYKYIEVGTEITKEQLNETLGFEARTVPQIMKMADGFGEYVGGFEELRKLFQ